MSALIKITGKLKITRKDLNGNILSISEGENLVLNTGLESLTKLLSGQIKIPTNPTAGNLLNQYTTPIPYLPMYVQFGVSSTSPSLTDTSIYSNGTLDSNTVSPVNASDIMKVTYFSTALNKITLQATLAPNKGNGPGGSGITYREAVLMYYTSSTPPIYKWFARRVFGDTYKDASSIIEAEWEFEFSTREV